MRFNTCALLFGALELADSSITNLRSPIRDHGEFLIQSVRINAVAQFEEYVNGKATAGFCREASSFQLVEAEEATKDGPDSSTKAVDPRYRTSLLGQSKHAFSDTRKFVQSMEYSTRKDDVRRALDMRQAWENTIVAEMKSLTQLIGQRATAAGFHATKVGEIKSTAKADSEILPTKTGKFVKTKVDEQLDRIAKNPAPYGGKEHNTNDHWEKRFAHYTSSESELNGIQGKIDKVIKAANDDVWNVHLKFTVDNPNFGLKWPTDFQLTAALEAYGLDRATTDTSWPPLVEQDMFLDATKAMSKVFGVLSEAEYVTYQADSIGAVSDRAAVVNNNGLNLDRYSAAAAVADATDLVAKLAAGNVDEFFSALIPTTSQGAKTDSPKPITASPSQMMARLTSALNVLQVRKLGLADARVSLANLIELAKGKMEELKVMITASVTRIATDLNTNEGDIMRMYNAVRAFDGVDDLKLKEGEDEATKFQRLLVALDASYEAQSDGTQQDASKSLDARINYVANSIRALHRHLLAFVAAHGKIGDALTAKGQGASAQEDVLAEKTEITTGILNLDFANSVLNTADLDKAKTNARVTAKCLLYGRVDGLEMYLEYSKAGEDSTDLCTASAKYGDAVLEKLDEAYKANEDVRASVDP